MWRKYPILCIGLMLIGCSASIDPYEDSEYYGFRATVINSRDGTAINSVSVKMILLNCSATGLLRHGDRLTHLNSVPIGGMREERYKRILLESRMAERPLMVSVRRVSEGLATQQSMLVPFKKPTSKASCA